MQINKTFLFSTYSLYFLIEVQNYWNCLAIYDLHQLYRDSDEISLYNSEELLWIADSRVAQWKRAGPITQEVRGSKLRSAMALSMFWFNPVITLEYFFEGRVGGGGGGGKKKKEKAGAL